MWTYVGPVHRWATRAKASQLLIDYHLRVRKEIDRRIERLEVVLAGMR